MRTINSYELEQQLDNLRDAIRDNDPYGSFEFLGLNRTDSCIAVLEELLKLRSENEELKRQNEFYISRNLELEDEGKEWTST